MYLADGDKPQWAGKTRSPIFMPRWASRLTLEVTGVRVERLQDISEEDAIAEGANHWSSSANSARWKFQCLWDRINAKKPGCSWADSPWAWVIEFKRVPA